MNPGKGPGSGDPSSAWTHLLHIGPPDTGSAVIRLALRDGGAALAAAGIRYAGPFDVDSEGLKKAGWSSLSRALGRSSGVRVIASAEGLAAAPRETIHRLATDAGPGVRVVATLRPLARVLPAYWQGLVQAGETTAFDDWLRTVLDTPAAGAAAVFWAVHRHDALVTRWVEVLGPDAVTVVVVPGDGDGRDAALRSFERLLALPSGRLRVAPDPADRDLTRAEAEAVRAFNMQCAEDGFGRDQLAGVRNGASLHLRRRIPAPDEAPIELPAWAIAATEAAAHAIVHGIVASGVGVIGDPDVLGSVPAPRDPGTDAVAVPQVVAATLSMGVLIAGGAARAPGRQRVPEPAELEQVPTTRIARVVVARVGRSMLARLRRVARAARRDGPD